MKNIKIIDKLEITDDGLVTNEGNKCRVFLRQGDMDGACGIYSTFMSLLICGLIDRNNILGMEFEGDKNIKKLWKEFKDYSPLMKEGTKSKKISDAINLAFEEKIAFKNKRLQYNKCPQNKKVLDVIKEEIENNNPIIIGVNWSKDSGHWIVVIGIEYTIKQNGNKNISKILALDPLMGEPRFSYWNQVILVTENQIGYKCIRKEGNNESFVKVSLDDCILMSVIE